MKNYMKLLALFFLALDAPKECAAIGQKTDISQIGETQCIEHDICEMDGYVAPYYVDIINEELSVLPEHILENFKRDGWHLYCTDKDIDDTWYGGQYGAVCGTTNYEEKAIYLEDREKAVHETPIHEFGHYFDSCFDFISLTPEFKAIYQAESESFCNTFIIDFHYDCQEFFAEGFYKYLIQPDVLCRSCPQLYWCMDRLVAAC